MRPLPTALRKSLEKAVAQARVDAEQGARKALEALAVGRHAPHDSMSEGERALRNSLRAHGRQLGDARDTQKGTQSIRRLEREVAYEHWHRMLFARFLAENGLLVEPTSQVAVTLEECEELARGAGQDAWMLAASFAQGMLPRLFRVDDPALAVALPPETRQAMQRLLADLPAEVFTADDSLGWTYQFWQAAEKDAVNARAKSGEKITGETLPAVTQLFTEPYMVQFLLHNTLGAWHAGKVLAARSELAASAGSEAELRAAVALDGCSFDYLRFVRTPLEGEDPNAGTGTWRPAAGTYPGWPRHARDLKVLDPCCGSGHFLVAAFDLLVRLRRAEEDLALEDAIRAVLTENLFGLELDARCTQIAAFHLALAAWRLAGRPIELPPLQIACSGIGPNASKEEWLALAEAAAARGGMPADRDLYATQDSLLSDALRKGLEQLHDSFQLAPELGSLTDPAAQASDLYVAGFDRLQPLLDAVLDAESAGDELHERAVAASGMAKAARILAGPSGGYTLVVTNVPYLGRGSHSPLLKDFADKHYREARADLATVFVARMLRWVKRGLGRVPTGTIATVTPQNWLFLASYGPFRAKVLGAHTWELVARLGSNAFREMNWWAATTALLVISNGNADEEHLLSGIDVSSDKDQQAKAQLLCGARHTPLFRKRQREMLSEPDCRIVLEASASSSLLGAFADSYQGLATADYSRYGRVFWELGRVGADWSFQQGTVRETVQYGGCEAVFYWQAGAGELASSPEARVQGLEALGQRGVAVSQMRHLPASLFLGTHFDNNIAAIIPHRVEYLPAIWAFCSSADFLPLVRSIDQKSSVTNATFTKVPFDLGFWQAAATECAGDALSEPYSDDPTQWFFHGHPAHAEPHAVLQVAVARLVGYRWPAELDEEMPLAPEARALVGRCAELAAHADGDGIVCLSSIRGEGSAADRLRSLLAASFGSDWSAAKEQDLLRAAGERFAKGKVSASLEDWLRDRFFEEHCDLFHARPFVWHVWDGLPNGFHALVHYHRLAGPDGEGRRTLEKLASTYLGEWVDRQRQLAAAGEEGADGRLAAATALQAELRKILEGEPPYDLFVRWKPLHEQPLGWDPDIDDGVRLNIRPFLLAKDVNKKGAGILRAKPDNTWSNKQKPGIKDRGKEPQSLRPRPLYPWFWSCDPEQHPEHRTDFGAPTPSATPAGKDFTGERWNGLHYTRAAKHKARHAAAEHSAKEARS